MYVQVERRFYQRALIGLVGNFIIENKEPGSREFNGIIEDISECGIRICVEDDRFSNVTNNIQVGDTILFQSYDAYVLYDERHTDVFSGEAEVVRVETISGKLVIGCKIDKLSDALAEYIKNKKLAIFIENGCCSVS